jgi:hypothetical protein
VSNVRERYECRNCFHVGPLNVHGGCESCGSQAVISQELMQGDTVYGVGAAGYWLAMRSPAPEHISTQRIAG